MNIKTILKNLDVSWVKTLWLAMTDKESLYEYCLDKANSAVNLMLKANAETVTAIRAKLASINAKLVRYADYIPAPWIPEAQGINQMLLTIYQATEDGQIVRDEVKEVIAKFQVAYSAFKSDDGTEG